MRNLLFLSLLFTSLFSFYQDKKTVYYKFKEGEFYTTHETKNGNIDTVYVSRKNGIQTESILKNGEKKVVMKLKIIWVKNSTYILRSYRHINNTKKFIKDDVICKIIETGDGYYIIKAKLKGEKSLNIRLDNYPPTNK